MSTVEEKVQLLYPGQRLTRDEFLRRWEAMPHLKFAELIGGKVYMPSPLSLEHGETDGCLGGVFAVYTAYTPGCKHASNATWLMLEDSPQPDDSLRILKEYGGQSSVKGKLGAGAPELAAEICLSSKDYDLHEKLELYQAAGVDEYLVVLVESREVRWHRLVNGEYTLLAASKEGVYRSREFPGLWLHAPALLAGDSVKVFATLNKGLKSAEHKAFVKALAKRRIK